MKIDLRTVLFLAGVSLIVSDPCAWAHTDVTTEQARDLIDTTNDLTVVDVREPGEYCDAVGHIPGALNYPLNSGVLQTRYEELPMHGPVLVVCRSGGRSNQAANFLDSKGFSMVYDVLGGMMAWAWETAPCKYGGGTGEPNDPYEIATAEDLMLLGDSPEDYDKHFILTADIDLDANLPGRKVFDSAVIAPDTNDTERWFQGTSFAGVFNGSGHAISNLTIVGASYLGLFGRLESGAKISNLGLEAVDVNGVGSYIGGLVGWTDGRDSSITMDYSTGKVTGDEDVGGLVGSNVGSIATSYSTATVSGDDHIGGLVGNNSGRISTSYSTATVTGHESAGGLVGSNYGYGTITSSFWDMETSGQAASAGGTGLTTAEMQDINTYVNAGWDFAGEILNGTCDYWQISPGDYPRLRYPAMPEGLGTAEEPYLIRDALDLGTVWFKPMAHYRLETSLDLSGIMWSMAVIPWFEGTFDGNGYVIGNLHIQGGEYLGLVGQLDSEAKISNLGLEAVDVNGTGHAVGGLVGSNWGNATHCYSSGSVSGGGWSVGGLAGYSDGSITRSYNTGTVNGENETVGGLVG
ncbi:MAG: rhodanese-like domain-containing protein, partial [Planctomycetota bacterium]